MIANISKIHKVARKTQKPKPKRQLDFLSATRNQSRQSLQKSHIWKLAGIGGTAGMIYAKESLEEPDNEILDV